MDASAIREIGGLSVYAHKAILPSAMQDRLAAVPSHVELEDLEKYQDLRSRFRGTLATDSIADFIIYVKRHAAEPVALFPTTIELKPGERIEPLAPRPASGFIDADKLSACVLFNLGTRAEPGHADDRALLALKPTAPYAAALAIDGKQLQQKTAIDWLEDWAEHVTFADAAGGAISTAAAITAIRKITIRATSESTSQQTDFRATRTALEDVEAQGAGGLPAEVRFNCTPYTGLQSRTLRFRLAVLTGGDKPIVTLRIRNLDAEKEAIAQDFKRVLLAELEGHATLTIGTFTT